MGSQSYPHSKPNKRLARGHPEISILDRNRQAMERLDTARKL